jgi:hypothetical protein
MLEQDDFTSKQNDYAIFLPAISGFYATFIGRQRNEQYVDPARMPANIKDMEQLNWLNSQKSLFPYRWSLYSAGHANLDLTKQDWSEDMVRNRANDTFMLGDSGGFQIAKGRWPGEWRAPDSAEVKATMAALQAQGPKKVKNKKGKEITVDPAKEYQKLLDDAEAKRRAVLTWLDGIADYSMTLDIPTWVTVDKRAGALCGINTVQEAIDATKYNNEYFINNRRGRDEGGTRILNVLQGDSHSSAEDWYQTMKHYCDPKQYPGRHFDGWAMGGQNMCDVHLILKRLIALKYDNLLQPGVHDWMHFLGTSKLEWAVLLTVIQRAVRKYVNPNFTISFDCASPFLATANGQIYHEIDLPHLGKWTYRMSPGIDEKRYAVDTRSVRDVFLNDYPDRYSVFEESPVSAQCQIKDICFYRDGDVNKLGKEGRTSWDSFSYALQMAHNVWMHIQAVQEANRRFDNGQWPSMLQDSRPNKDLFVRLIDRIFSAETRAESEKIIEDYSNYWTQIIGTRGFVGKKAYNTNTSYNQLFKENK